MRMLDLRLSSLQTSVAFSSSSFVFVGDRIVWGLFVFFFICFFSEMLSVERRPGPQNVREDIKSDTSTALRRKRSADLFAQVAHQIGTHQKSLLISCWQPSLHSSLSSSWVCFIAVAGDLCVRVHACCVHASLPTSFGRQRSEVTFFQPTHHLYQSRPVCVSRQPF